MYLSIVCFILRFTSSGFILGRFVSSGWFACVLTWPIGVGKPRGQGQCRFCYPRDSTTARYIGCVVLQTGSHTHYVLLGPLMRGGSYGPLFPGLYASRRSLGGGNNVVPSIVVLLGPLPWSPTALAPPRKRKKNVFQVPKWEEVIMQNLGTTEFALSSTTIYLYFRC